MTRTSLGAMTLDKKFTLNLCGDEESFYQIIQNEAQDAKNVSAKEIVGDEKYYIGKTTNFTMNDRHLLSTLESDSKCSDAHNFCRSSIVTFTCDRLSPNNHATVLSNRHDCFFLFDVKTRYACGIQTQIGTNPWAVFSVIAMITLLVYCLGSILYRRKILYKRGWKQFPQWEIWCGIATIIWIAITSCLEKTGLKKNADHDWFAQDEVENGLIDELDEDLGTDED
ncbi:putative mannose 6-phosphate receptor-like protein [Neolecta irregularis DAH-3]|uniref:Putative mannose 6-phosphate receptor-like protein n=1 Tax=Neolecta irregularis (strain DAH-3) TaxID=1198029 RepID=A0A1U7LVA7_NEOID|nr:putative mannose 6-phosphate receptor-like protein [Neolecta irregularis DAH-3]|eukprot:OLL26482.1 putative mannose 6-phosphate receptor-like protein [Neolecta irregularis DAH-3]